MSRNSQLRRAGRHRDQRSQKPKSWRRGLDERIADQQRVSARQGCPTPAKLAWNDRESAEVAMRYSEHRGRDQHPQRSYLCPCGQWHVTSRPDRFEMS